VREERGGGWEEGSDGDGSVVGIVGGGSGRGGGGLGRLVLAGGGERWLEGRREASGEG